jgi:hypothetical protein
MVNEMAFSTYHEIIAWELRGALSRYYETWLEVTCKGAVEGHGFITKVEQCRLVVVVLTCALVEHVINFYLCTKCNAVQFHKLERKALLKKWTEEPGKLLTNYKLLEQSQLGQDLARLINRRNAIVHAKPMISIDGDNRHAGNEPSMVLDENSFMEGCATLPFLLIENLLKFDHESFNVMFAIRTTCAAVQQELNGARYRLDYLGRLPEKLVTEIMEQGYRRETARLYGALIGEVPRRKPDGTIPVKSFDREIARLKPLKFFAEQ